MSSALRQAAQQALEVLILAPTIKVWTSDDDYCEQESPECKAAITALRAALDWPDVTLTGTYKEFNDFVRMACMHETIYEDSEGRDILVIRVLDAYGMAHSWALEHARHNFP